MKISRIFTKENIENTAKRVTQRISNSSVRRNLFPLGATFVVGSLPVLATCSLDKDEYAGKKSQEATDILSLGTALVTSIPLHNQIKKIENKAKEGSVISKIARGAKFAVPVLNALVIAPAIVSKVILPFNHKLEKCFKDGSEDREGLVSLRMWDNLESVFEK